MESNLELRNLFEDYSNHIIISLSNSFSYHSNFSFNLCDKSIAQKHFDTYNIDETIETICYNLIKNGKCNIYYKYNKYGNDNKKDDNKLIITPYLNDKNKDFKKIKLIFPKSIIKSRKRIIKSFKYLDYSSIFSQNVEDIEITQKLIDASKIAKIEIDKICNPFYVSEYNIFENYSEIYCLYRVATKKLYQRKLLDYVLDKINDILVNELSLKDDDILIFNGFTQSELINIIDDLKNYNSSLGEISSKLYKRK